MRVRAYSDTPFRKPENEGEEVQDSCWTNVDQKNTNWRCCWNWLDGGGGGRSGIWLCDPRIAPGTAIVTMKKIIRRPP